MVNTYQMQTFAFKIDTPFDRIKFILIDSENEQDARRDAYEVLRSEIGRIARITSTIGIVDAQQPDTIPAKNNSARFATSLKV